MMQKANLIKSESNFSRLSSLSTSRDLSLGGSKPKKNFTPNLQVTRKKSNTIELSKQSTTKRLNKTRNHSTNKGKKWDKNRFLQTAIDTGVFSEGTGIEIHKPKSNRFPYKHEVQNDEIFNKSEAKTCSKNPKTKIIKPRVFNIVEEEETEDEETIELELEELHQPVFIPLSTNNKTFSENIASVIDETLEAKIVNNIDRIPLFDNKHVSMKNPILSLIKLPDVLPFSSDCGNQCSEGNIGKMFVRESGKIEVEIGNSSFNLDVVDASAFFEMVMTLPGKNDLKISSNNVFTEVGTVEEHLVLSPDWDDLNKRRLVDGNVSFKKQFI